MSDYRSVNRANWDERAPAHAASPDYAFARFVDDPSFLSDVVRFDVPRLGDIDRAARRPPAVPHRHGHDLARAARRADDRPGLLARLDRRGPPRWPSGSAPTSTSSQADVYDAVERARRARPSTSSSPASARCAGCPTCGAGPASSPASCAPAAASSSARGTRCCGRSTSRARTGCSSSSTRTSSAPSRWSSTSPARTSRPTSRSPTTVTHEWNHGLGEIVTALLDARAGAHRARGARQRALGGAARADGALEGGEWRLADRPWRLPHSYTLQAVKRGA